MKKKLTVFLIVLYLCGFTVFSDQAPYAYAPYNPLVTVYADEQTVINSADMLIKAIEAQTATLNTSFKLSISSEVDAATIIETAPLSDFTRIQSNYSYYKDSATGRKVAQDYYTYTFTVTYRDDIKVLKAFKEPNYKDILSNGEKALLEKAKGIINKYITKDMSDYEKVLAIHDYLVLNAKYDDRVKSGDGPAASRLAQGVILNGTGVCSSYAGGMCLLLGMVDIECIFVAGTGKGEGDHAWNKVKIDGEWYNIDATWADPTPDRPGEVSYEYFGLTDAEFAKTHKWDEAYYPQKAVSKTYGYYRYNNLVASSYSEFKGIITNALEEQKDMPATKIKMYVTNYNPKQYKFDFMYDLITYNANISYTLLDDAEGEMNIVITKK